jgi:hypothetical protein
MRVSVGDQSGAADSSVQSPRSPPNSRCDLYPFTYNVGYSHDDIRKAMGVLHDAGFTARTSFDSGRA